MVLSLGGMRLYHRRASVSCSRRTKFSSWRVQTDRFLLSRCGADGFVRAGAMEDDDEAARSVILLEGRNDPWLIVVMVRMGLHVSGGAAAAAAVCGFTIWLGRWATDDLRKGACRLGRATSTERLATSFGPGIIYPAPLPCPKRLQRRKGVRVEGKFKKKLRRQRMVQICANADSTINCTLCILRHFFFFLNEKKQRGPEAVRSHAALCSLLIHQ